MTGGNKLRDPFGHNKWLNISRWTSGANVRKATEKLSDISDRFLNGSDSYAVRFAVAKQTLAANEATFSRTRAIHHVAITRVEGAQGRHPHFAFTVYLNPGHSAQDAGVPNVLSTEGIDPSGKEYSIPVRFETLEGRPVAFGFAGGDRVVGEPALRGVCGFVFSQEGSNYFITNSHVLTEPDVAPLNRKCWYFDVLIGACSYGDPLKTAEVNIMDAVVVRMENVAVDPLVVGSNGDRIIDRGELRVGQSDRFFYVTENSTVVCTNPAYVGTVAQAALGENRFVRFSQFWKLTALSGRPQPGHSGAALCFKAGTGLIIMGLVFGGVPERNEVWAFSSSDLWPALFNLG